MSIPASTNSIHAIGRIAFDLLSQAKGASIGGVTSRGVFLSLDGGGVVFLSFEPYHGPLTLNLSAVPAELRNMTPHSPVEIQQKGFNFPTINLALGFSEAVRWEAQPASLSVLPAAEVRERLAAVAEFAAAGKEPGSLGLSFLAFLGLPPFRPSSPQETASNGPDWFGVLHRLRHSIETGRSAEIIDALTVPLGLGAGLTPSGDDLVAGVLLALSRWGSQLRPQIELSQINAAILPLARRKTTALSAGLIACAAAGQSDERLITALDGILTGKPEISICSACLRDWGSSSGVDALAGMALVMKHA